MKKFYSIFTFILLFIFGFTLQINAVEISEKNGLEVEPTFFDLSNLKPGDQYELKIRIKNHDEPDLKVESSFFSIEYAKDPKKQIKINENENQPPATWLKKITSEEEMTLPKGKEKIFKFNLQIPEDTKAGSYFPLILFAFKPNQKTENIGATAQIGSQIYIQIKGENLTKSIAIQKFQVEKPSTLKPMNKFKINFQNAGEIYFKPRGTIEIFDPNQVRQSSNLTLNDKYIYLLPGQYIQEEIEWKDDSIANKFFPPLGNYQAVLKIYDETSTSKPIAQEKTEFFVLPFIYIAYSLGIIFLLLILLFLFNKKLNSFIKEKLKFIQISKKNTKKTQ